MQKDIKFLCPHQGRVYYKMCVNTWLRLDELPCLTDRLVPAAATTTRVCAHLRHSRQVVAIPATNHNLLI
jgi:hypothetical protein